MNNCNLIIETNFSYIQNQNKNCNLVFKELHFKQKKIHGKCAYSKTYKLAKIQININKKPGGWGKNEQNSEDT